MQNRPDLRLPPPKQTVKMDLTAIMREVLAEVPMKGTRSTGALPPDPLVNVFAPAPGTGGPQPSLQSRPLSLIEFDDIYSRLFARFRRGLGLNGPQWDALRHVSFALAVGGLVDGDADSVLRFLTRVRNRARTHLDGEAPQPLTPIQVRVLGQMLQAFQNVA